MSKYNLKSSNIWVDATVPTAAARALLLLLLLLMPLLSVHLPVLVLGGNCISESYENINKCARIEACLGEGGGVEGRRRGLEGSWRHAL